MLGSIKFTLIVPVSHRFVLFIFVHSNSMGQPHCVNSLNMKVTPSGMSFKRTVFRTSQSMGHFHKLTNRMIFPHVYFPWAVEFRAYVLNLFKSLLFQNKKNQGFSICSHQGPADAFRSLTHSAMATAVSTSISCHSKGHALESHQFQFSACQVPVEFWGGAELPMVSAVSIVGKFGLISW